MDSSAHNNVLPKKVDFLKTVPVFSSLNDEMLTRIAQNFHPRVYQKNEIILRQGDPSHELYIVKKGKVRVYKTSPNGDETIINIFTPTEIIGEFAVMDNEPRSATAKAINQCTLLAITRDQFLQHLHTTPTLAMELCRLVINKARWTTKYAETLAQYSIADRLLHLILHFNQMFGQEIEAQKHYELNLGLNQTDLAALVGARRGWVNQILNEWRERSLIEYKSGNITILDLPRMQKELDNRLQANNDVEW